MRSPLHDRGHTAGHGASLPVAASGEEAAALAELALCDLSALAKVGVKGAGAAAWLQSQGIAVPGQVYDTAALADGGLIVRMGGADFFLESGASGEVVERVSKGLDSAHAGVYRVERQDATILLAGRRAVEMLAQLCAIDFTSAPVDRVVLTRVGTVNCAVLPGHGERGAVLRLWVDYTFGVAFWEILCGVGKDLGARVVRR